MFKLYNTLTNKVEDFQPINAPEVKLYVCGPTVYDYAHIGNFRTFLFADLLRRYIKYKGYKLTHVMNITDVDDKIIARSTAEKKSLRDYTTTYLDYFLEDFDALGAERPVILRATDHIKDMTDLIKTLGERGYTYAIDGSTYYRISKFQSYGKLSKVKFEGNIDGGGGRVDADEYDDKESARDFVLWKAAKNGEPSWETELGKGRPGWHIECSAMSMKALGESFDIHAGGADLKFPHHENEIAQSEGATGKPFVKYWIHAEFLNVEGQKMSKSLGNFFTFRDLIAQGYTARAIRYLLLSAHYRKQFNFTLDGLKGVEGTVERFNEFKRRITERKSLPGSDEDIQVMIKAAQSRFEAALDDDLNTSEALAAIHDFMRETNTTIAKTGVLEEDRLAILSLIDHFDSVFNIFGDVKQELLDADIQNLIEQRQAARAAKNFALADDIRGQLTTQGIILEDTKDGIRWRRK